MLSMSLANDATTLHCIPRREKGKQFEEETCDGNGERGTPPQRLCSR